MTKLALVRHGQSTWNFETRFTGWADVRLTERGESEARKAGLLLKDTGIEFSASYTSLQQRAIKSLFLSLDQMDRLWMPAMKHWRLNERHYGLLTGMTHMEAIQRYGPEQIEIWQRGYDIAPPPLPAISQYNFANSAQYAGLQANTIPKTESLKSTLERLLPYWTQEISPRLKKGESLLIVAHGNSLRAIIKFLFNVSDPNIASIEVPTGNPLLLTLPSGSSMPISARYLDEDRAMNLPSVRERRPYL